MPLNTYQNKIKILSSSIEPIIKNVPKLKERLEKLKNENVQRRDQTIEQLEHKLEELESKLREFEETKQEEDILTPFGTAIQDLEKRETAVHFSDFYNTFIPLYETNKKLSNLDSNKHLVDNVKYQLDTRLKKIMEHDVLCVLLNCAQQYQGTQETITVEALGNLAQTEGDSGLSIWKDTLTKCLSDLSNNKETINIQNTINIIQTKLKHLPTEKSIDTIQGVLVNIQDKIKTCFLTRKTLFSEDIQSLHKEIQTDLNDSETIQKPHPRNDQRVEAILLRQEVHRSLNNLKNIKKSHSFTVELLQEAFTLFFQEKKWDKLGRGYLFFNKITPDGIAKIRNILKNDTNDSFNVFAHEKKIFAICQIIKLKAHRSKPFSRRSDVHTQYQALDNFLSKTYPHLYDLKRPPEESQLTTHLYNEENTRELLEYLTHTISGQSSLPRPSSSL